MSKNATSPTRERILDKSLKLFAEHGAAGVSLADLSRELKMSNAALLYHFRHPDEIFSALVDRWSAAGADFTNQYLQRYLGDGPQTIVVGFMEATLALLDEDDIFAKLTLAIFQAAQSNKLIQEKLDLVLEGGRVRIRGLLARSKTAKAGGRYDKLATFLHAQVVGALIYEMVLLRSPKDKKLFRDFQLLEFRKTVERSFV